MNQNQPNAADYEMALKNPEDEYVHYVDSSEVILEFYKNRSAIGLEKYFLEIEEWLARPLTNIEDNKPLVISADEGVGKKTLIVKWIEYHKQNVKKKTDDIILAHFATTGGNNSNYFYAIYRILIKLREALNVNQKVELLEEKLRKFFGYWLEVCDRIIVDQIVNDQLIIILFDGIDHFVDHETGKETNVAFWLPRILPFRVRIIVTCEGDSNAMAYFKKNGSTIYVVQSEATKIADIIKFNMNRKVFLNENLRKKHIDLLLSMPEEFQNNPLFVKTYLSTLIPYPTDKIVKYEDVKPANVWDNLYDSFTYDKLKTIKDAHEFLILILSFYSEVLMEPEKFRKVLHLFCVCQKGLSIQEIFYMVKISAREWNLFLAIFKEFLIFYRTLFQITNSSFKKAILDKFPMNQKLTKQYHEEIAECLEKSPMSIRKLEEQTYHLFMSKSFFKLKETVSIIENFLLLFNPNNKYDLCRYWQKLEENGFDPAIEYNKAIEGFEMHYHPSAEDIFRIILQVSRFLKEFSDFETNYTPEFRHPPIVGSGELEDIGLDQEIKNLNLFMEVDLKKNNNILNPIEQLNVDIPSNREKIQDIYIERIKKEIQEDSGLREVTESTEDRSEKQVEEEKENDEISSAGGNKRILENNSAPPEIQKVEIPKNPLEVNVYPKTIQNNNLSERQPSYYYYKRWLWMIFPWACISENRECNYSEQIQKCFASATQYMSVISEKKFTQRALRIALEAKVKKKLLYAKKDEVTAQLMSLKSMKTQMKNLEKADMIATSSDQNLHGKQQSINKDDPVRKSQPVGGVLKKAETIGVNKSVQIKAGNSQFKTNRDSYDGNFFVTSTNNYSPKNEKSKENTISLPMINNKNDTLDIINALNTSKILNKSKLGKERIKLYEPDKTMPRLEKTSLTILPRLKDSINSHTEKEIEVLRNQNEIMKKELDNLVYSNSSLEKKLRELKIIETNGNSATKDENYSSNLSSRIEYLENSIERSEKSYEFSKLTKVRIQKIINICKRNTQQNEEWIRNFHKLIKWEGHEIRKVREDITSLLKIYDHFVNLCGEKRLNHMNLIQEIKNNLDKKHMIDEQFTRSNIKRLKNIEKSKINKKKPI